MRNQIKDIMYEFVRSGDRIKVCGVAGIYQSGVGSGATRPLVENGPGEYIGPF